MALTGANYNKVFNEGYQTGYNAGANRPRDQGVTHAPSPAALKVTQAEWNAAYNTGYNAGYIAGQDATRPVQVIVPQTPPPPAPGAPITKGIPTTLGPPQPPAAAGGATVASVGGATIASAKPLPTVYGHPIGHDQMLIIDTLLNEGQSSHASRLVLQACIYAAMGESDISYEVGNGGPLQTTCNMSAYNGGRDIAGQAHAWYNGGECFARGGISYAREYNTAWQIANATEENLVWSQRRGDSYARSGYSTAQLTAESDYIVAYFLPGLGTSGPGVASGGGGGGSPAPNVTIQDVFKGLNWAGDFETLWQHVQGGSNEAAAMADRYYKKVAATDYVKPSG